ncbi:hypothetical protein DPMN_017676 [Dreissena polymorpha]|uniref:Uncharacterized protein n=1 Tax=Dreissena polymorpha TaxID=45954 RepID=A0A9D4NGZ3_DREPO|nr:hypothetical protein DPMN_017676 [Dreissena polymorpha]
MFRAVMRIRTQTDTSRTPTGASIDLAVNHMVEGSRGQPMRLLHLQIHTQTSRCGH